MAALRGRPSRACGDEEIAGSGRPSGAALTGLRRRGMIGDEEMATAGLRPARLVSSYLLTGASTGSLAPLELWQHLCG